MEKQIDSSQIPDGIILNILSKLPTKSLCKSKTLSKPYNSFIQNPNFRPKIPSQWTDLPPKHHIPSDGDPVLVHIYSIENSERTEVSASVETYTPPLGTFTVSIPIKDEHIKDPYRNFEYGYDPLSKKHKVVTYRFRGIYQVWEDCFRGKTFEVLTLGEDSPTWRSVKNVSCINSFSDSVTLLDGRLFWFDYFVDDCYDPIDPSSDDDFTPTPPQIISFDLTKEEVTRIEVPGETIYFDYYPIFEFEGSLCFLEILKRELEPTFRWELNLWLLKDIDNSDWMMMKRVSLPLSETNLDKTRILKYPAIEKNGEILISGGDNINEYLFSYNFLNEECRRMKIIGEPFQCPDNGTDSEDDMGF